MQLRHLCVERGAREVDEGREHARRPQRLRRLGAAAAGARSVAYTPPRPPLGMPPPPSGPRPPLPPLGPSPASSMARVVESTSRATVITSGARPAATACIPSSTTPAATAASAPARHAHAALTMSSVAFTGRSSIGAPRWPPFWWSPPSRPPARSLIRRTRTPTPARAAGGGGEKAEGGGGVEVGLGDVDRIFDAARRTSAAPRPSVPPIAGAHARSSLVAAACIAS